MAAYSSGYQSAPGSWSWPKDLQPEEPDETEEMPAGSAAYNNGSNDTAPEQKPHATQSEPKPTRNRRWRPRQCRICLETVFPSFTPPSENLPAFLQSEPSVKYDSEGGRLIRPCKCKGSSRYVHENCLQEWRHADPSYGRRYYYECPTCHFQYRLERMQWGRWVRSQATQVGLTIVIFGFAIFILGFIADPIIDLYLDPFSILASAIPIAGQDAYDERYVPNREDYASSWIEHFLKGFTSLGLIGSVKFLFTMRPWDWFNLRNSGVMGNGARRPGATGRDRISNFTWLVVITGVLTFIYTVWKLVRSWSRRVLEKAGERVMDVQGDDADGADDMEDDVDTHTSNAGNANNIPGDDTL